MNKIDHIGVLVQDLDEAVRFAREVLGFSPVDRKTVAGQGVAVARFEVGGQHIELMEPLDKEGSLAKFLKDKRGKLHHIAIGTDQFEQTVGRLKSEGLSFVGSSENESYSGSKVTFLHPRDGWDLLWEFVDKKDA